MAAPLLLLLLQTAAAGETPRAVALRYEAACISNRGAEAAGLLSPSALAAFDGFRRAALGSMRADLQKRVFFEQMQTVLLRALYSDRQLDEWTGAGVFAALVSDGLVGGLGSGITFGDAVIEGDHARILLLRGGAPFPMHVDADRIEGQWRIDPTTMMQSAAGLLAKQLLTEETTTEAFLTEYAREITSDPTFDPWLPLAPGTKPSPPRVVEAIADDSLRGLATRYDLACSARRGREAASLLSPGAVSFFDEVRRAAIADSPVKLAERPYFDQVAVVLVRALYPAHELMRWNGRSLARKMIEDGQIDGQTGPSARYGEATVFEGTAKIPLLSNGQKTPLEMEAAKINGRWLLDPVPMLRLGGEAIALDLTAKGVSPQDFLTDLGRQASGQPTFDPWLPLMP